MGCHGHGHWRHGCWDGPGSVRDPRWDEDFSCGEAHVRGPYERRLSPRPYAASRVSPTTAAAQLEAHLSALRDEVRAVEADLAAMQAAGGRAARPTGEI